MSTEKISHIAKLHAAQETYFATCVTRPIEWRKTQLKTVLKMLEENEPLFMKALQKDLGKCAFEGCLTETVLLTDEIALALANLKAWMEPVMKPTAGGLAPATSSIVAEPRGTTLVIGPFNYPVSLTLGPAISALAAGNTCILKPSELCPAVEAVLFDLVTKYFDPKVLAVVKGAIPETTALMDLPWGLIFFTGSERVARIIGVPAAKTLSPLILELGGKSPCIITKNHPQMKAMCDRIMWGKTINAGQTCVAPDYVLVHEDVADAVIEGFKASLIMMFGDTDEKIRKSVFSRNVSEMHTQRLVDMIDDTLKDPNAKLICGGTNHADIKAKYFPPTLILNPKNGCRLLEEEIFGCVLPIITYKTDEDAIAYANAMRGTPLALYIFTDSHKTFDKYISQINSGGTIMNDCLIQFINIQVPFGGCGTSGIGKGHGKFGFDTFTHQRACMRKPCYSVFEFGGLRYPPYDKFFGMSGHLFRWVVESLPIVPANPGTFLMKKAVLGLILAGFAVNIAEAAKNVEGTGFDAAKFIVLGGIGGFFNDIGNWFKSI